MVLKKNQKKIITTQLAAGGARLPRIKLFYLR